MRLRFVLGLMLALLPAFVQAETPTKSVTIKGATYFTGLIPGKVQNPNRVYPVLQSERDQLPDTYDAIAAGKATPVKGDGQGSCGDCWAWARTSSLESAVLAANLPGKALSEQDTTVNASDEFGCDGGMMDFNYEVDHGVTLESTCPFTGGYAACNGTPAAKGVSYAYVGGEQGPTDDDLKAAIVKYGSVAVTVAAAENFDVDSGSDRMTSCYATGIDHMVSLVGYRPAPGGGVEFKMKNSWGKGWGASGYAYMKRGCNEIASGDQSAMVITLDPTPIPPTPPTPPTPPSTGFKCTVTPAIGRTVYTGQATLVGDAEDEALNKCHDDGHWICRVQSCVGL